MATLKERGKVGGNIFPQKDTWHGKTIQHIISIMILSSSPSTESKSFILWNLFISWTSIKTQIEYLQHRNPSSYFLNTLLVIKTKTGFAKVQKMMLLLTHESSLDPLQALFQFIYQYHQRFYKQHFTFLFWGEGRFWISKRKQFILHEILNHHQQQLSHSCKFVGVTYGSSTN